MTKHKGLDLAIHNQSAYNSQDKLDRDDSVESISIQTSYTKTDTVILFIHHLLPTFLYRQSEYGQSPAVACSVRNAPDGIRASHNRLVNDHPFKRVNKLLFHYPSNKSKKVIIADIVLILVEILLIMLTI